MRRTTIKQLFIFLGTAVALTSAASAKNETVTSKTGTTKTTISTSSKQEKTITVKAGDTAYKLAQQHHLTLTRLRELNPEIPSDYTLKVGQVLRVSVATSTTKTKTTSTSQKPAPQPQTHTVRAGDTLFRLSQKYKVTVAQLRQWNSLKGNYLRVGQVLRISPPVAPKTTKPPPKKPAASSKPTLPKGTEKRLVYSYAAPNPGETLAQFAGRYGLSVTELKKINPAPPRGKWLVPRRLIVPVPPKPQQRSAVTHRRVQLLGATFEVLHIDLRYRDVLVAPLLPPQGGRFTSGATVRTLTASSGAEAVINGSYFHPRSYAPAGDIVMGGRLLTWGRLPVALRITPDNRASIARSSQLDGGVGAHRGMETVVASGPTILAGGAVIGGRSAVFRDEAVFKQAERSAVGLRSSRDLLLVSTHDKLSVTQMAKVMQKLGAKEALLLDGGSSVGLSYDGSMLLDSPRKVSYGLAVYTNYKGRRYMH